MFHYAIGPRVVPRYPNVSDVVVFFKVGEQFDECRPVVCDNFTKCAPLEENVFKDLITNGLHGLSVQ